MFKISGIYDGNPKNMLILAKLVLLYYVSLLLIFVPLLRTQNLSRNYQFQTEYRNCDWFGSALENSERSIRPIYLQCTQGEVIWKYPKGALRIVFRYGSSDANFRMCIKADKRFRGARIFLEESHSSPSLRFILGEDDGKPLLLSRCFGSDNSQAVLYVEANLQHTLVKTIAHFYYNLHSSTSEHSVDNECQPCSEEKLLRSYCTSDFVVRGTIVSMFNNEVFDRTEVLFSARKVHRQTAPIFERRTTNRAFDSSDHKSARNSTAPILGTIYFTLKCKVKPGSGEFILMGNLRLGDPIVECAPKTNHWVRLKRRASSHEQAQCILDL